MLLMFLAAACRHSAGFTWAYNSRLYFLSYYPYSDVGTFFSISAIVGGSLGVIAGGNLTDRMTYNLLNSQKYNKYKNNFDTCLWTDMDR